VLLQGKLEKLKSSDWRWMLETNLLGPVRTVAAVLPHMLARRSGHIVNAVSAGGLAPTDPLTVAYDAGHAALAAYTRSLARELEGTGVNVSLYLTGVIIGPNIGLRWITDQESIQTVAEIGLILLLFVIGLEIDLRKMASGGAAVLLTGALQVPICIALGLGFFLLLGVRDQPNNS